MTGRRERCVSMRRGAGTTDVVSLPVLCSCCVPHRATLRALDCVRALPQHARTRLIHPRSPPPAPESLVAPPSSPALAPHPATRQVATKDPPYHACPLNRLFSL
uniref:Uncharacterized protein n=1 Tax=Leishmania guyanensis TaxID=5670 RepID=A0A1E1J308_LEIGU|nr:Hypothetical protein BN36_3154640 [Leishmania guyanensis]